MLEIKMFFWRIQGNFRQFGPPKCFNGYNFWVLSWFADRKVEVIPTNQSQLVQLATFVDYVNTTSSQPVLLKVGNYYMVYNRAKGCNRGSGKSKDMVTVVLGNSTGPSSLVASLNDLPSSNSFLDTSFVAKRSLSIVACQVVNGGAADYVTLSISLTQAYCSTNLRAKRWHWDLTYDILHISSRSVNYTSFVNECSYWCQEYLLLAVFNITR